MDGLLAEDGRGLVQAVLCRRAGQGGEAEGRREPRARRPTRAANPDCPPAGGSSQDTVKAAYHLAWPDEAPPELAKLNPGLLERLLRPHRGELQTEEGHRLLPRPSRRQADRRSAPSTRTPGSTTAGWRRTKRTAGGRSTCGSPIPRRTDRNARPRPGDRATAGKAGQDRRGSRPGDRGAHRRDQGAGQGVVTPNPARSPTPRPSGSGRRR